MAWRAVAALLCFTAVACAGPSGRPSLPSPHPASITRLRVQTIERGRPVVRSVALEDYVRTAVLSEYAPGSGEASPAASMYEVQAIVSRTYAVSRIGRHDRQGFDLCATTHCQLFEPERLRTSRWMQAARTAVSRTAGTILWHDRAPVEAVYHADCGGHTSAAADVWGGAGRAYLIARPDAGPARDAHASWRFDVGERALVRALDEETQSALGGRLGRIEIIERDTAGRAVLVSLRGARVVVVPGDRLRELLAGAFGPHSIRSTLFEVSRTDTGFRFTGRGFGHGVGLCQAGAVARLRAGASPEAVLEHYFPRTRLIRMP
ncbi:MAG TPA: SpoIID/LytB domain-containing protein [Vicinamibacterales bacterium]|nr:SpoIID/LytB domain-containing protein [Vicinamibacterales bacterium]